MDDQRRANDRDWEAVEAHLVRNSSEFLPLIVTRAEGSCVYDRNGRAILDSSSGHGRNPATHGIVCHGWPGAGVGRLDRTRAPG